MKLKTEYITEHNRFWSEINNLAKEAYPEKKQVVDFEMLDEKADNYEQRNEEIFICVTDTRKQDCFYHTLVLITKCSVWRVTLM